MCFVGIIKKDLPNFPDEIIDIWLKPFANELGWPPKGHLEWENIFMGHNINYWRNVYWRNIDMDFDQLELNSVYNGLVDTVYRSYKSNEDFCVSSRKRIERILDFIILNKKIPKPIILIRSNGKNKIADGNHRISAYRIYRENGYKKLKKQKVWLGELQDVRYEFGAFFWSNK